MIWFLTEILFHLKFYFLIFNFISDPTIDDGGSEIQSYKLYMSAAEKDPMREVYTGIDREFMVSNLEPGISIHHCNVIACLVYGRIILQLSISKTFDNIIHNTGINYHVME